MTNSLKKRLVAFGAVSVAAVGVAFTNSNYFEMAKNIEIYANVYKELNTHYVDDIDPAKLMRIGIDAMTNSLDPFTNYISEADIEGYRIQSTGKYGGVGFRTDVHEGGQIVIIETYTGSPAEKVGLKPGDVIVKVDGKAVKGKNDEELNDILKGSPGTKVSLTLQKAGNTAKTETVEVTREEIKIPSVPYFGMLNDNIGYITLTTFTEDASENVIKALRELKTKNQLKGVVFDLRDNGGGLLTEAVNVVNAFCPKDIDVVDMRSKVKEWDKNFKTQNTAVDADIPLTILVNSHSASASEIVSGALQDLDRGVVIGQKSYGKGLVQNTKDVGYGARVKLTTAKYYIPSGRCIQSVVYKNGEPVEIADSLKNAFKTKNGRTVYDGGGIIPDVKIKTPENSAVVKALQAKHKFFDFATQYCVKNEKPSAASAKEFRLKDADFDAFLQYLQQQKFEYETETEVLLKKIDEKAKGENMLAALQSDFTALRTKIATEKKNDLMRNKAAIMGLLEKEIVGRYFAQKGKIEHGLAIDEEVKEAIKLLQDAPKMKQILGKK
jgi:carboxyl-terminal processing protease